MQDEDSKKHSKFVLADDVKNYQTSLRIQSSKKRRISANRCGGRSLMSL